MVYKFLLLSDEVDDFRREIEINSDATFKEFNDAILDSVGYTHDQITSFFVCSENWEKLQEILLIDMGLGSDIDSYLMDETHLDEFAEEVGQRLLFVFDNFADRSFFIELKACTPGRDLDEPVCTKSKGKAPKQLKDPDFIDPKANKHTLDDDFYGSDEFDPDELDSEGFGDMSFDENGNEIY